MIRIYYFAIGTLSVLIIGCYRTADIGGDSIVDGEATEIGDTGAPLPGGTLLWVRRAGGELQDYGRGIATLPDGSVAVSGRYGCGAVFAPGDPGEVVPDCYGEEEVFVARYGSDGEFGWMNHAGGGPIHVGHHMAALDDGRILFTGHFESQAVFGDPGGTALTAEGQTALYMAMLTDTGGIDWVTRSGGSAQTHGLAVAALPDGTFFSVGHFNGTAILDDDAPDATTLVSGTENDAFIVRYARTGEPEWTRRTTGAGHDSFSAAAGGRHGEVAVTGYFAGDIHIGTDAPDDTPLASAGGYDIVVAAFDEDGVPTMSARAGGTEDDYGTAVAFGDTLFVTGGFKDTAVFGEGESASTELVSAGNDDLFLARYRPTGELMWAVSAGGPESDAGQAIAILPRDRLLITGQFSDTARFGKGERTETELVSRGDTDIFLAVYTFDGQLDWAVQAGGEWADRGYGVAVASDDAIYVTGYFSGDALFGDSDELSSADAYDVFIAKYAIGF